MPNLTQPIYVQSGLYTIDRSVVPSLRQRLVEFRGNNLKPGANCNFYFDTSNVTQFIQPASVLVTNGVNANIFIKNEGLYCPNTHAFASVISTSMGNTIYISEDFASMNLVPYGSNVSIGATSYNVGDLVFQTSNNSSNVYANSFLGRVVYFKSGDNSLHVRVLNGVPNTVANVTSCILYKVGSGTTLLTNVNSLVTGAKFPANGTVQASDNSSNSFLIASYTHNHGLVVQNNANANLVTLSSNVSNTVIGNNIFIVSGNGVGQHQVVANLIGNNVVVLTTPLTTSLYNFSPAASGAAYYALGNTVVDAVGKAAGIFVIPEDVNFSFPAGNRLFTINDSNAFNAVNATMRGSGIYAAAGEIAPSNTTTQTPVVDKTPILSFAANGVITPVIPTSQPLTWSGSNNPLATPNPLTQLFTVPTPNTSKQTFGIFVTSIDLFFANKPAGNSTQFPVTVMLMSTINGIPTSEILGISTVQYQGINVCPGANVAQGNTPVYPATSNTSANTRFKFPDPVFLQPGVEYAIGVYTETPDYLLWTSQVGGVQANGNSHISVVPFVGSLYLPQNSSAWTPLLGTMLMFVLNKAQFNTAVAPQLTFQANTAIQDVMMDMSILSSSDLTFPVAPLNYGMITTIANTLGQDTSTFSVNPNQIYNYGHDLKTSSINSARRRVVRAGNSNSTQIMVTMSSTDPDLSPMFNAERLGLVAITNLINNGSISNNNITITNAGNHINANNITVTFSAPTGTGGITATANVLPAGLSGNNLVAINITNIGAGYVTSPTITISEPSAPTNASAVVYGEDQKFGGNGLTRYVTRTITLASAFAAGDLAVFLDCIRPQGTDIQVYYKVLGTQDTDVIENKTWQQMTKVSNNFSPDDATPITLQFETGTGTGTLSYVYQNVTYPLGGLFGSFQIKVVLFANDPTVPPLLNNMRAIAVPPG